MQDRYLFRGKRTDNGEWVIGNRIDDGVTGQVFIHAAGNSVNESDKVGEDGYLQFVAFEVDPSTICQCTGHDDKNANLIFEYDIVKFEEHIGVVMWDEESASYCVKVPRYVFPYFFGTSCFADKLEIVGNKFDNPELLEVQNL